jgi:hypothetical protein
MNRNLFNVFLYKLRNLRCDKSLCYWHDGDAEFRVSAIFGNTELLVIRGDFKIFKTITIYKTSTNRYVTTNQQSE